MARFIYDINAVGKIIQEDEVPEGWYPTPKASWEAKAALEAKVEPGKAVEKKSKPKAATEAPKEKAAPKKAAKKQKAE